MCKDWKNKSVLTGGKLSWPAIRSKVKLSPEVKIFNPSSRKLGKVQKSKEKYKN